MKKLALLKPIDKIDVFQELLLDDFDEILEKMRTSYLHKSLSSFESVLNTNDKRIKLLEDAYYMRNEEYKFVNFILEIFEKNNNCCIIDTHLFNLNYDYFLSYLSSGIDINYQCLLLHQYINFINTKKKYFCIRDKNLLKLFVIFGLRENKINQFFLFQNEKICIFNNYDHLLPIFYEDNNVFQKYYKISKKNDLYLI